jgi:uncharacterized protein (TIGR00251 family)
MLIKRAMADFFECAADGLALRVKVIPGARRNEFAGIADGRLRVKIAAAPQDGKANAALVCFFAKELKIPKRQVVLKHGEKSREKTFSLPVSCAASLTALEAPAKNGDT